MSTVDPNAPKPSRRRTSSVAGDPRLDDPSGSLPRGTVRNKGRAGRSGQSSTGSDPLARLAALEAEHLGTTEGTSAVPAIVPSERPAAPEAAPTPEAAEASSLVDDSAVVPVIRTSVVDAAIPTGPMAVVDAPPLPAPTPTTAVPITATPATESVTAPIEDRTGSRAVVWRRTTRPRVRRVTRVLRHIDTWSVFKVALVFNMVAYLVSLTAAVLLWNVAYRTGTVDNVEKFFEQFGWESFDFKGGELYHNLWIAGLFVAIGFTGLAVMLATLFNLITDLVGGIRVSVLEEEVITRASAAPSSTPAVTTGDMPPASNGDHLSG